ncbi:hypothetical protein BGZ90_006346 [Linnemannia elongata]|nr:hypothetical protein BGZ90_006346 [Linnemannia elongata]
MVDPLETKHLQVDQRCQKTKTGLESKLQGIKHMLAASDSISQSSLSAWLSINDKSRVLHRVGIQKFWGVIQSRSCKSLGLYTTTLG